MAIPTFSRHKKVGMTLAAELAPSPPAEAAPLRMSRREADLFIAFLNASRVYIEFGCGGSTLQAAQRVNETIVSIDSSIAWLQKVQSASAAMPISPQLVHVDIGPTGHWGFPSQPATWPRWPAYHEALGLIAERAKADLILIDGRFRVACFAQAILHGGAQSVIAVHDFASRPQYAPMRSLGRQIAIAEDLSLFQPLPGVEDVARAVLQDYCYDPA